MDRLSPEKRSELMSHVRSRNTKPEMAVRTALHRLGYRYTLHRKDLPGTPDLVFVSRRKVLFVHGCYWHGHECKYGRAQSKSNVAFWQAKLASNIERDKKNMQLLTDLGWQVEVVWECEIKQNSWIERICSFLGP